MKSEIVRAGGAEFAVFELDSDSGAGPVELVWAHGWGQTHAALLPLARAMRRTARSVLVDLPGFGASPLPPAAWGTADYADAIAEWLGGRAPARRIWIAHSFGCRVGLQLAARHPDRLAGLFLIAAAGLPLQRTASARARVMARRWAFRLARQLTPEGAARDRLRDRFGSADYRAAGKLRPILVKAVSEDLSAVAGAVRCPAVLVYGDQDTETPPELGTRLNSLIPQARLVVLRGFDHWNVLTEGGHQIVQRLDELMEQLGVSALLALVGFLVFAARRLLVYLHLYQQEEYDGRRFLAWLIANRAWDRRLSLALAAIFAAQMIVRSASPAVFAALAGGACLGIAAFERDPRRTAKKALVMTTRARRIYAIALALIAALGVVAAVASDLVLVWIVMVQLVPIALVGANLLLAPFEARVQARYWREARAVLERVDPIVIAVTGSYGKTSVKHILGHVLESAGPTLITPGSVNTAMGIARVIRERLGAHHRYFVVEMGAYGIGSIERLCALTPPRIGIVSAIGKAHYERFKSLDAVARAKFELALAVRDNGGTLIVAADVMEFAGPREFIAGHRDMVVTVGADGDADLAVRSLRQTAEGIVAAISWRGHDYELHAPLFGLHQGGNIALAFAAACTLGMAPEDVVASLRSTPQIAHRLEVKRQSGGMIVIDDAYNSNPVGFASALALLDTLRQPGGRRILVTPGMAELGSAHEAEHARIGSLAAGHVDVLVAVAPHRVAPLARAFAQAAPEREIVSCPSFADAQIWLDHNLAAHDVVLIENDLPDLLEQKLRL